jgi:flagellin
MPLKVSMNGLGLSSKHLMRAHRQVGSAMEKMVTGRRINRASDDAANVGVATNLSAQRMGTRAALRNIADGVSIMSTVEEVTNQVAEMIKRMREVAIQGASDTLVDPERKYLQKEMQALQDEMNRLALGTEFNGISLTDGTHIGIELQMGANNSIDDRFRMRLPNLSTSSVFGANIVGVKLASHARESIETLDAGLDRINKFRAGFGLNQNVMAAASAQAERYSENMAGAESRVQDADYAHQSAQFARAQMILQANFAVRSQAGIASQAVAMLL